MRRAAVLAVALGCANPPPEPPPVMMCDDQSFLCGRIRNIAHRGGAALAPENTVAAFSNAVAIAADVLEMDVRRTADGVVILMHDPAVDRTTDGTGDVSAMTFQQIQALDAGYRFTPDDGATYPFRGTGVRVPSLDQVLAVTTGYYMIEIKDSRPTVAPVLAAIDAFGIRDRVIIASLFDEVLAEVREVAPDVFTSMSAAEMVAFDNLTEADEPSWVAPAPFIQPPYDLITDETLARAQRHGLRVHPWTVDDLAAMNDLIARGVDGIITDDPALLNTVLGR